jgi:hypothetical protein
MPKRKNRRRPSKGPQPRPAAQRSATARDPLLDLPARVTALEGKSEPKRWKVIPIVLSAGALASSIIIGVLSTNSARRSADAARLSADLRVQETSVVFTPTFASACRPVVFETSDGDVEVELPGVMIGVGNSGGRVTITQITVTGYNPIGRSKPPDPALNDYLPIVREVTSVDATLPKDLYAFTDGMTVFCSTIDGVQLHAPLRPVGAFVPKILTIMTTGGRTYTFPIPPLESLSAPSTLPQGYRPFRVDDAHPLR